MRIDELGLAAFGRFHGQRLALAPGLNLIYGENEAGKTTLQKFMLGMLYSFQKRGQRRAPTFDAVRYRPWAGADYRGTLTYTLDDGRSFRVERSFEPGRDAVRIYDAVTGADLTDKFTLDRRKEVLFAEAHLGLDEEAFRSTAWVGQLAVGQLEAGRELVSRVANLQESGREDLSVKTALTRLEEMAKEIGTERAASRPYGRVMKALTERRQELDRTEALHEAVRGWEGELTEKRGALEEVEAELQAARRHLDWALLAEAESRLERVEGGRRRIRELRAAAEADVRFADIPLDGLTRLRSLAHEAEEAAGAAEAWQARVAELQAQVVAFGDLSAMEQHGAKAAAALEAADDARAFWAERERALTLDVSRLTNLIEVSLPKKPGLGWVWATVAGLAVGGAVAWFLPLAGAAVAVVLALGAFLWGRQQTLKYEAAAVRREGLEGELGRTSRELEALRVTIGEKQNTALALIALAMGGAPAEPAAFRAAYADWQGGRERRALLEGELAGARRRAEAEGARSARAAASAATLLAEAGVADADAYAEACARREAREKALAEAHALEETLGAVLAGVTPELLSAEVDQLRAKALPPEPHHVKPSPAVREETRALEAHHASLSVKVGEIGARIETALREAGDPAELKRELEALLEEKTGYDEELAALDLARTTIEGVAGDIHREFAPRLNHALGQATTAVTGGRYSSAQVDEQAAMRLLAEGGRTVELSALSGGTADQLYLSLRLALLDLVTAGQERVPLLLDDPFVQYDDRRAAAAVAFVAELARDRQVVLMTCHRREVDLAQAAGAPFHLIALTDAAEE